MIFHKLLAGVVQEFRLHNTVVKWNALISFADLESETARDDCCGLLILIGMRGDDFISLFFLDKILSAEFLSKISKHFWR